MKEAMALSQQLVPLLFSSDKELLHDLQKQAFVECIRVGDASSAIAYAQEAMEANSESETLFAVEMEKVTSLANSLTPSNSRSYSMLHVLRTV